MRTIILITNQIILAYMKLIIREKLAHKPHQIGEPATTCLFPRRRFSESRAFCVPPTDIWIWLISELPDGRFYLITNIKFTCTNMLFTYMYAVRKELNGLTKELRFFVLSSVVVCYETLCRSHGVKYLYVYKSDSDCVVSRLKCINNEYQGIFFKGITNESLFASVLPLRNIILKT